jgi:hypothetical protein
MAMSRIFAQLTTIRADAQEIGKNGSIQAAANTHEVVLAYH